MRWTLGFDETVWRCKIEDTANSIFGALTIVAFNWQTDIYLLWGTWSKSSLHTCCLAEWQTRLLDLGLGDSPLLRKEGKHLLQVVNDVLRQRIVGFMGNADWLPCLDLLRLQTPEPHLQIEMRRRCRDVDGESFVMKDLGINERVGKLFKQSFVWSRFGVIATLDLQTGKSLHNESSVCNSLLHFVA